MPSFRQCNLPMRDSERSATREAKKKEYKSYDSSEMLGAGDEARATKQSLYPHSSYPPQYAQCLQSSVKREM